MTATHQLLALAIAAATASLVALAGWSWWARRGSGGRADHRFAVDRLVLVVLGGLALNGLLGIALLVTSQRPADPLHLLYGPAALITLLGAVWLGRRAGDAPARGRRDVWLLVGGLVLLGLELRLWMTG